MNPVSQADGVGEPVIDRPCMEVDIACVGFGPAMGGFLSTLVHQLSSAPDEPAFASTASPGMPLQVLCYERADELAAGVSGVVTRAAGIRETLPALNPADIPMACEVRSERVLYLLDPHGASRRSLGVRAVDTILNAAPRLLHVEDHAFELPWTPAFLHKQGGLVLSIGQFNQWVADQLMQTGLIQIWPGTPVAEPLFAGKNVLGVRLVDQGVSATGEPNENFTPGMEVRARLTVVGDGPSGAVGQALDDRLGMPNGNHRREWAMGMKFVIELPEEDAALIEPGTVWHTIGFPEPEIFGFLYAHPDRLVSVGIFVPSWMHDPLRTSYQYLQHYIQHPALARILQNGTLRSWGAKSLEESGRRGESFLCGHGFARIGEGSGSTNVLTGSGVDEAWTTGTQLADAVVELLRAGKPFSQQNLAATYVRRRRTSWVEKGVKAAEHARDGFQAGFVRGMIGLALAGLTSGRLTLKNEIPPVYRQTKRHRNRAEAIERDVAARIAIEDGRPLHEALLSARGWPDIRYDGRLLISHQDALLLGGKVQAMPGFADHLVFRDYRLCSRCEDKTCVAMCSGQALSLGEDGLPKFEREKCVHCGGCLWNCGQTTDGEHSNIEFRAGSGGLHSVEN